MGLFVGLNWLDLVVLLLLIVGLVIGYVQGLLRQVLSLAALYIGAILGAQYYTIISGWFRFFFENAPARFINALGFLIILFVVTSIINWLVGDAYNSSQIHLFPALDHLTGALVGLVSAAVLITVFVPIVTFASVERWPWADSMRVDIVTGLQTSRIVPAFESLKPVLLSTLGPWLPGGLPSLFNL